MKLARFKDFDSFFNAIFPDEQAICSRMRGLIQDNFPELREKFAYGVPYYHRNTRVCFLYPASLPYSGIASGVSFGLTKGHLLSNHQGLIDMGDRKEVGYIRILTLGDIREDAFLEILYEAVMLDEGV